ncbi:MAG: hypothetical protein K9M96_04935 [Deltaproteobacteria bacterium]|nr:hypothetical protein [Deltaproteobacteria bacterium]MCF8119267.1 hypothetical protein [Deltaproteobacteria bacterium]
MIPFSSVSPLKILEKSSQGALGAGNLGVLIARAGVGKTACLIHIAFDKIFSQEKLVHVALEEGPEKVMSYYSVIYYDLLKALGITDDYEYRMRIERNRMILAYLNQSFDLDRLRNNLKNLAEGLQFTPDALIVDGLDFEKTDRKVFEGLKDIAQEAETEIWLSALSHRHITEVNDHGIPYPCSQIDDLFSLIVQLKAEPSGIFLSLLKDHDQPGFPDTHVRLDPNTFLAMV